MSTAKTARWLDLIAFLLDHRFPVTREQIFGRIGGYLPELGAGIEPTTTQAESARRMFERDKDDLRQLGIEIETLEIKGGASDEAAQGYRLRADRFYLPYLELASERSQTTRPYPGLERVTISAQELSLLERATRRLAERTELPLAAQARSARKKLSFDLPLSPDQIESLPAATTAAAEAHRALAVLQEAVAARTAVQLWYYAIGPDAGRERVIEPWGLFFSWGHWYAVGRAREHTGLRVLRMDRMREVRALAGDTFAVPASFRLADYLHRAPWDLGDRPAETVRVRFAFPESRWVQGQGVGKVIEATTADGGAVLEFGVRERGAFLRWLLTFQGHAAVLSPSGVAEELAQLRRAVAALYPAAS
jgi:proteasome accessory factor B